VIALAFAVKVRDFIFAVNGGHAVIAERHPLPRIFECGPDDMLQARSLGRRSHGLHFGDFFLGRKVRPKKRDAIRAVRAVECPLQALDIIHVSGDDFRAQLRQFLRLGPVDVSGERSRSESTVRIINDGPDHAAALRSSRT